MNKLILKPLHEENLSSKYLKWMNDPSIVQYTESRWNKYSMNDLKSFIKGINSSKKDFIFGIFIDQNNKYIGNIKIGNIDFHHQFADIGIIIGDKEEWGKGYATESFKLGIKQAFSQLNLYKLTAGAYANNIGSIKALQKAGFKQCGKYINHCQYDNNRVDVLEFEIINKRIK